MNFDDLPLSFIPDPFEDDFEPVDTDYTQWVDDPVGFIQGHLGYQLTDQQLRIVYSVLNNPVTNVQSCHGTGKTFSSALLAIWWVFCVRGLCLTTAPTHRQVKDLLWREINRVLAYQGIPNDGQTHLTVDADARALGFSSSNSDENTFQGFHSSKLLIIQDEACGIAKAVDDGAIACATGSQNKVLRIGNPVTSNTPFHDHCLKHHIRLAAWDHPNVQWAYQLDDDGFHQLKPDVAARILASDGSVIPQADWPPELPRDQIPGAISISFIEETRRTRGERSPFWESRIEARFPEDSAESIIPESYWKAARERYDADPEFWETQAVARVTRRFGLDVGDVNDDHAIARWDGPVLRWVKAKPVRGDRLDVLRAAQWLTSHKLRSRDKAYIDAIGVGAGALAEAIRSGLSAVGVRWSEGAVEPARYLNAKAEDFFKLREHFRQGTIAIAPFEGEREVMRQFAGYYYEEQSSGKIKMEPKTRTIQRLGSSPNMADAVVLASRGLTSTISPVTAYSRPRGALTIQEKRSGLERHPAAYQRYSAARPSQRSRVLLRQLSRMGRL